MRGRTVNNIKFLFLEHLRNLEHKFHDRLADHSVIRTWRFIKLTHLLNWRHIRRFKMLGHSPWLFNSYSLSPSFLGWFRFLLCIYMLVCELSLCHLSRKVTNRDRGANPGLHWLCFDMLCDWCRKLAPLSQPTMQNQRQARFGYPRFPALMKVCLFFLHLPAGSFLRSSWLLSLSWFSFCDTQT